jgi:hypothetical protein
MWWTTNDKENSEWLSIPIQKGSVGAGKDGTGLDGTETGTSTVPYVTLAYITLHYMLPSSSSSSFSEVDGWYGLA